MTSSVSLQEVNLIAGANYHIYYAHIYFLAFQIKANIPTSIMYILIVLYGEASDTLVIICNCVSQRQVMWLRAIMARNLHVGEALIIPFATDFDE